MKRTLLCVVMSLVFSTIAGCNGGDETTGQTNSDSTSVGGTTSVGGDSNVAANPPSNTGANPQPTSQPTGTPTSKPTDPCGLDAQELAFLTLINDYRAQNGLGALTLSADLCAASAWLSEDMATKAYLDHTDSTGRAFDARIEFFGYTYSTTIGENIAYGYESAQDTFTQWKNSPAHNANMLGKSYKAIGIARFNYSGSSWGWYWTTDFGGVAE